MFTTPPPDNAQLHAKDKKGNQDMASTSSVSVASQSSGASKTKEESCIPNNNNLVINQKSPIEKLPTVCLEKIHTYIKEETDSQRFNVALNRVTKKRRSDEGIMQHMFIEDTQRVSDLTDELSDIQQVIAIFSEVKNRLDETSKERAEYYHRHKQNINLTAQRVQREGGLFGISLALLLVAVAMLLKHSASPIIGMGALTACFAVTIICYKQLQQTRSDLQRLKSQQPILNRRCSDYENSPGEFYASTLANVLKSRMTTKNSLDKTLTMIKQKYEEDNHGEKLDLDSCLARSPYYSSFAPPGRLLPNISILKKIWQKKFNVLIFNILLRTDNPNAITQIADFVAIMLTGQKELNEQVQNTFATKLKRVGKVGGEPEDISASKVLAERIGKGEIKEPNAKKIISSLREIGVILDSDKKDLEQICQQTQSSTSTLATENTASQYISSSALSSAASTSSESTSSGSTVQLS